MSIIKKVLANVVQTLTRSEQRTAKKNIGLGDSAHQPPVDPQTIPTGSLVWDPDHNGVYRLLENWSYTVPWGNITKKVRVMPTPEYDPLCIDIKADQIGTTVSGLTARINAILTFGKPYVRLDLGNSNEFIFEYSEFHLAETSSSRVFRGWQESYTNGVATKLEFMLLTITSFDKVNYEHFTVNL